MKRYRAIWAVPAQVGVWLVGVISLFVISPPRLTVEDAPSTIERFLQFAVAILVAAVFVLISGKRKTLRRNLAISSIVLLVVGVALFGTYLSLTDRWTCPYPGGAMIIGSNFSAEALRYKIANPNMNVCQMLLDFGGQSPRMWSEQELANRRIVILGLFTGVTVTFSLSAILIIEALATDGHDDEPAQDPAA